MKRWDDDDNYIGYLDGEPNRRVYLAIRFKPRNNVTELTISGHAGDGSCGQINMHIQPDDITPAKRLTSDDIERLWAIWERWHLNGMRAGCEHQRAALVANHQVGDICPICGYSYSAAWLAEPLPFDVEQWLCSRFVARSES